MVIVTILNNLSKLKNVCYLCTAIVMLLVSACGFKPMYSYDENKSKEAKIATEEMTKIKVAGIKDREGQLLRFKLEELLNPYASYEEKSYLLKVKLELSKEILSLRKDSTLRRQEIHIRAKCKLLSNKNSDNDNNKLTEFIVDAYVPYSISSETDYKSLSAIATEESSKQRATAIIADKINQRLRLYFIDRAATTANTEDIKTQGELKA